MSVPIRNICIVAKEHAFAAPRRFYVPEGSTFASIVAAAELTDVQKRIVGIFLNEHFINPELWHCSRPKAKDRRGNINVILLVPIPRGGRSSKKILATSITLAAVAAAAVLSGGTLLPAVGPLTAAQVSSLGAAAVVAAGSMAARLIAPPPIQPKEKEAKEKSTAGIAGNPLAPNENLPTVFGFARISPPFISSPAVQGGDERERALACLGVAGQFAVKQAGDILINGVDIDNYEEADYEIQRGLTTDGAMTHDATITAVMQSGGELTNFVLDPDDGSTTGVRLKNQSDSDLPDWFYFKTNGTATQWWIDLAWIGGIIKTNDGAIGAHPIRVEFKQAGSVTWIKGPTFHFKDDKQGGNLLKQYIRFIIDTPPGGLDPDNIDFNCHAIMKRTGSGSFQYQSDVYFGSGAGLASNSHCVQDGALVYLNPASGFPTNAQWEVRVMRGLAYQYNQLDLGAYTYVGDASLANFFEDYIDGSDRVAAVGQTKYQSTCNVARFITIDDVNPAFNLPAGSQVFKLAVGVVNKQIDSISIMLRSESRIWNGTDWNTIQSTNNPAALARGLLLGSSQLNARPVDLAKIEEDVFEYWYDYCVANNLTCNLVWDNGGTIEQALSVIAACGSARLVRRPKWAPIIEEDRTAENPVQTISGLNSFGIQVSKSFIDLPHAWRVEYRDEDDDFREKNLTVYAPGYSIANATRIDSVRFDGATNPTIVTLLATRGLRQLHYRQATYNVNIGLENLFSRPGDLLAINHDVVFAGHLPGRVKSVVRSGGDVYGLVMWEPINIANLIEMANGTDPIEIPDPVTAAGAIIRLTDGDSSIQSEITQGANDYTIDFVTPFADPGTDLLKEDCIVGFGGLGKESIRGILTQMEPGENKTALLTIVDEAPLIHA